MCWPIVLDSGGGAGGTFFPTVARRERALLQPTRDKVIPLEEIPRCL